MRSENIRDSKVPFSFQNDAVPRIAVAAGAARGAPAPEHDG